MYIKEKNYYTVFTKSMKERKKLIKNVIQIKIKHEALAAVNRKQKLIIILSNIVYKINLDLDLVLQKIIKKINKLFKLF